MYPQQLSYHSNSHGKFYYPLGEHEISGDIQIVQR